MPAGVAKITGLCGRIVFMAFAALLIIASPAGAQDDILEQEVSLSRQNSSIYSVLNQISGQTGYYFVYDTDILNSDKRVRVRGDKKTVSSWLSEIIDDPSLDFNIIENHVLVYRPAGIDEDDAGKARREMEQQQEFFTIQGRVLDETSRTPLSYATVGIKDRALGITTNSDGVFVLKISDEHAEDHLTFSHLGYRTLHIPVRLFRDNRLDILMETDYFSIQEVMIRYFDPLVIVRSALEKRRENYSEQPVYLLSFYREGVLRNSRFINYSEAFFQIYKSPFIRRAEQDQVRLLQSRTISNVDQTDTLILKIRAGIRSSLELDFISNIPDFLEREYMEDYVFTRADIISMDGKRVYAVEFEQKPHIAEPLYKGILYIDMESLAFLGAGFEVHPKYVNKAQDQFVTRKNRNYRATVDKAAYTVSYKYHEGRYHLNHVRADLHLRYRRRYQIFSNSYHVFVEMATSRIDTDNVSRFARREAMRTDKVFIDGNFAYDPDFWSGYSIIAPEEHITRALSRIDSQVESITTGTDGSVSAGRNDN